MPICTLAAVANLPLLTTIAAAFFAAWVLGLITQRIGLSPIVGYLLAGVVIGPKTPGFVGDTDLALQLAEVGVILLMFGVGLHFHLKDLLAVKRIAVPGAIGQSLAATLATALLFHFFGWELKPSLVLGMAMAVASTVVLTRVLMDRGLLSTPHGHVAIGWLIVEDIFTVLALVFVPLMAGQVAVLGDGDAPQAASTLSPVLTVVWAVAKLVALVALVLLGGSKVVPWILARVARLRSPELFTLTVLVLSIAIAVGSAYFFGASVALGAFLAGMVVGQSPASHQAAADAMPMRDAFGVIFFVSVGMLFDPSFVVEQPLMVAAGLAVVLLLKPLAALVIVAVLGYPLRTGLTVAIGLGQIGEFSFILAQVARDNGLMPEEGTNVLVAVAMVSITVNPFLFHAIERIEGAAREVPWLWRLLNAKAERRAEEFGAVSAAALDAGQGKPLAVIVGYGPVGRVADALLIDAGFVTSVIDTNIDTVAELTGRGRAAVFGDASRREVLEQAGLRRATHVVVTLPHGADRAGLVRTTREINPSAEITVRARYLAERDALTTAGANRVVYEEGEAGIALARAVMQHRGLPDEQVEKLLRAIRTVWRLDGAGMGSKGTGGPAQAGPDGQ